MSQRKIAPEEILKVRGLCKQYSKRFGKKTEAVKDVSFTLYKGEIVGLIGESGAGKSTVGKMIAGLEKPDQGEVRFQGADAVRLCRKNPKDFYRRCQMIYQDPFDTFDPRSTVETILTRALKIHRIGNSRFERRKKAAQALQRAGLSEDEYLFRRPHELSGGQLQRISILRSMLLRPHLLIADEPVSMLDVSIRAQIVHLLAQEVKENGTCLLFISHDLALTGALCDRIAVMQQGEIVEMGDAKQIMQAPCHPYTQLLLKHRFSAESLLEKRSQENEKLAAGAGEDAQKITLPLGICDASLGDQSDLYEKEPRHFVKTAAL